MLLNPWFMIERALRREIIGMLNHIDMNKPRVLDVGCGEAPYAKYIKSGEYVGVDVEVSGRGLQMKQATIWYDGTNLPFENKQFDVVLCTQVLEHCVEQEKVLSEMARVLKPGGSLVLSVPFIWEEHEKPFDYIRYTSEGIVGCCTKQGLNIIKARKDCGSLMTLFAIFNSVILAGTERSRIKGLWALYAVLIAFPCQVGLLLLDRWDIQNSRLYLNTVLLCTAKAND